MSYTFVNSIVSRRSSLNSPKHVSPYLLKFRVVYSDSEFLTFFFSFNLGLIFFRPIDSILIVQLIRWEGWWKTRNRDRVEHGLQPHRRESRLLAAFLYSIIKYQAKTIMTSLECTFMIVSTENDVHFIVSAVLVWWGWKNVGAGSQRVNQ